MTPEYSHLFFAGFVALVGIGVLIGCRRGGQRAVEPGDAVQPGDAVEPGDKVKITGGLGRCLEMHGNRPCGRIEEVISHPANGTAIYRIVLNAPLKIDTQILQHPTHHMYYLTDFKTIWADRRQIVRG